MRAKRSSSLVSVLSFALVAASLPTLGSGCGKKEEPKESSRAYHPVEKPVGSGSGYTAETFNGPMKGDHVASARILVEDVGKGDYEGALTVTGAEVRKVLDAKKLEAAWKTSSADGGAYVRIDSAAVEPMGKGKTRVRVRALLAKGTIDAFVSFDDGKDEALGLVFTKAWTTPTGIDFHEIEERDVTVGAPPRALPGTLTRPKGGVLVMGKAKLRPGILLVHGSGPNDRDESLPGGARPFRDLALGLAAKGAIVVRYDKRTYAGHGEEAGLTNDNVTLKSEFLEDMLAAATALRASDGVDPSRVFVLGHSEAGWLVPMFFAADPQITGGIVLAGNARSLEDVLVPQYEYLSTLPGSTITKDAVADMKKRVERVKDKGLSPKIPASDLPLGLGAPYWQDVRRYDALAVAKRIARPMLFLQGGRDYEVTEKDDLALWKQTLETRTDVKFLTYPTLNHAFFAGEGPITPDEYATKLGHVDQKVIDDIAAFMFSQLETAVILPAASSSAAAAPSASAPPAPSASAPKK